MRMPDSTERVMIIGFLVMVITIIVGVNAIGELFSNIDDNGGFKALTERLWEGKPE